MSILSRNKIRFYILTIIALFLSAIAAKTFPEVDSSLSGNENLFVTFIDVGQGDSTLIKTPDGETILIDGGEKEAFETNLSPFLQRERIDEIDIAIATHYHSDHYGGIYELVKNNQAKNLVLPDFDDSDDAKDKLQKIAEKTQTNLSYISSGDLIETNCDNLEIKVIHPIRGGLKLKNFQNNNSLVLFIRYFDTSFIITGDIESEAEKAIVGDLIPECDVLKIPHHGSFTSSSREFLRATNPTYAVISAGRDNPYGHPHYEVLDRLDQEDILVYRTDRDGDIIFEVSETGIKNIK